MIWTERCAIGVFALVFLLAAVTMIGIGDPAELVPVGLQAGLEIALPAWALLRLADFVFNGPNRRAARRVARYGELLTASDGAQRVSRSHAPTNRHAPEG